MKKLFFFLTLLASGCWLLAIPALAQLELPAFLQLGSPTQQQNFTSPITASDLCLNWSANTYTPFAYSGKPLPTYDSVVRVSLIPLAQPKINLNDLVYKWYLDGQFYNYASGENRQEFMFKVSTPAGNRHFVEVKIENKEGQNYLQLTTLVNVVSPEVVLYPAIDSKYQAALGISEATTISPGQEQGFTALPFFINISKSTDLEYQWLFEGQTIAKIDTPNQFSVKVAQGEPQESFSRELAVVAENPRNPMQRASGKIEIVVKK